MTGPALAALVSLLSAPPAPKHAAVIAVGPDVAATAKLQESVEGSLENAGVTIVPMEKFIPLAEEPAAHSRVAEFTAAVETAQKQFFDTHFKEAADSLANAENLLRMSPDVPPGERVRLHVLKCATLLETGKPDDAGAEAEAALTIGGKDARIPILDDLPPTVSAVINDARGKVLPPALVRPPAGAPAESVLLDGATIPAAGLSVPLGKHAIYFHARGYRSWSDTVTIGNTPLRVPLAVALTAPTTAALEAAAGGGATPAVPQSFWMDSGADVLVIVSPAGAEALHGAVLHHAKNRLVATSNAADLASAGAFALWVAKQVLPATVASGERHLPRGGVDSSGGSPVISVDGGLAYALRSESVTGPTKSSAGSAYGGAVGFNAVGPQIAARARFGSIEAGATVDYLSYSVTKVAAKQETTGTEFPSASGGNQLVAALDAGYRVDVAERFSITPSLGFQYESYAAPAPASSNLQGVFPSWSRTAVNVDVLARFPLGKVSGWVGAGVAPISSFATSPSGSLGGGTAKSAIAPRWRIGAAWNMDRLSIGAEYRGEMRQQTYSDKPTSGYFASQITGATKRSELFNVVSATASWRFGAP